MSAPGPLRVAEACALIVTYRPDLEALDRLVRSIEGQVGRLLVFDNASSGADVAAYLDRLEAAGVAVFRSAGNVGLGAAMNQGARFARQAGCSTLLILDQDSVPAPDMVRILADALAALEREGPVAAVGPQFEDARSGRLAPFVQVGFPFNRKHYGGPGQRVACDFLISSGTLVRLATFDRVGGLDESLFIDNVDLEWCQRARSLGLGLHGICDARMHHSIGDSLRASRLAPEGWTVHQPVRLYYIMRNRTLLYRRAATPAVWVAQDVPRLVLKFFLTLWMCEPRGSYLRHMLRGIGDGIRGRSGPMPVRGQPQ